MCDSGCGRGGANLPRDVIGCFCRSRSPFACPSFALTLRRRCVEDEARVSGGVEHKIYIMKRFSLRQWTVVFAHGNEGETTLET